MTNNKQAGFGAVGVLAIIVVVAVLAFGGWYTWHKKHNDDKKTTKTSQTTKPKTTEKKNTAAPAKTDAELISDAVLAHCRTTVKASWKDSFGKTVSDSSITATAKDPIIKDDFARVANATCASSELSDAEHFGGFTAFLQKTDSKWTVYTTDTQPPACSKFDGKGWPVEVVPSCYPANSSDLRKPQQ